MVCDRNIHSSKVCAIFEILSFFCIQIRGNIESISNCEGYVLIFWSVVDRVLTNELERIITIILFEYSEGSFGEWNP